MGWVPLRGVQGHKVGRKTKIDRESVVIGMIEIVTETGVIENETGMSVIVAMIEKG